MIYDQLGDKSGKADTFDLLGRIAFWRGDYEQARIFFEESMALYEHTGSLLMESWFRVRLAYVTLRQGEIMQAQSMFQNVLRHFQDTNNMIGLVFTIEGFASLYVNQGQTERAAQLFAWADAMRNQLGDHRPPVEQASVERDLAVIRSALNVDQYAKLSTEGSTMTIDQAIAFALEE